MVLRKKVVKKRMKSAGGVTAAGRRRKKAGAGGGQTKLAKRLSGLSPREKALAVARLRAKRKGR